MKQRPHPADAGRVRRMRAASPPSRPAGERSRRRAVLIAAIVSGAVACAVFLPSIAFDFVRDDRQLLLDGSRLRAPGTLLHVLASDYWSAAGGESGLWRPWAAFTLWIDGNVSGWSPGWFHAANVLAHGCTTFLLVLVVAAYGGGPLAMWLAGLWFAFMPAHVESVAWIAGRTDVWCALFALAALILARAGPAGRRAGPAAFALALLSKESAATMAPVFALPPASDAAPAPATGAGRVALRAAAPYLAVLALWAPLHALVVRPHTVFAGPRAEGAARLWTALAIPAWELRFLLPGVGHGPDWMIAPLPAPAPVAIIGLALYAIAAVLIVRLVAARDPLATPLGIVWFPFAGMSALVLVRGAVFSGERHVYLASAGAAWAVAMGVERSRSSRALPAAITRNTLLAVALIVAWSARDTLAAIPEWRDEETMYDAMAREQPRNATGPLGQALARIERGDDAGAWDALARAAAIDSSRFEIALYRAGIALRRGRPADAMMLAREAGARVGWNRDAVLIEALALQRLGRWVEARNLLEELSARDPDDRDVRSAWGAQVAGEARTRGSVAPSQKH